MNLISSFNRNSVEDNESLIRKALSSATGVAEALIPQNLEKEITNTILRLSPELALLEESTKKISGKSHDFNRTVTLPDSGSAMGENGTTRITQSSTQRANISLKVVRRKGAVTNFLQDTSGDFIDAAAYEMENHLVAHIRDLIFYILYGNKDSNQYEFSGLDHFIATNRINEPRYGTTPVDFSPLDEMIDRITEKQALGHKLAFGMSPRMLTKFSSLATTVRYLQPSQSANPGLPIVDIGFGHRAFSYRDIPIIQTSSLRPKDTMTTVTSSTATTGGTIPDTTTYNFAIVPLTQNGEEMPFRLSQTTGSAANTNTITLSFTAFPGAYKYKIYAGTQYAETLKNIVPAFVYDPNGTQSDTRINTIVVTSSPNTANFTCSISNGTLSNTLTGTPVGTHMLNDIPLEQDSGHSPAEVVYLWDLDPIQGLGKFVYTNSGGSKFGGLVTTEELAKVDDYLQFLVKSYPALVDSYEATSVWYRGLRVS